MYTFQSNSNQIPINLLNNKSPKYSRNFSGILGNFYFLIRQVTKCTAEKNVPKQLNTCTVANPNRQNCDMQKKVTLKLWTPKLFSHNSGLLYSGLRTAGSVQRRCTAGSVQHKKKYRNAYRTTREKKIFFFIFFKNRLCIAHTHSNQIPIKFQSNSNQFAQE